MLAHLKADETVAQTPVVVVVVVVPGSTRHTLLEIIGAFWVELRTPLNFKLSLVT